MKVSITKIIARTEVEPRPYQQRIVTKVTDMFGGRYTNVLGHQDPASRSVMIESPTGSGKTVMGLMSSLALQDENEDLVVAWVAMRRNLLAQAQRENDIKGIKVRNIHYVSMFDKRPVELIKASRAGRKILMVVDEAQHDAASSMAHLHNVIDPAMVLGLTATPFRTDRMKLCFDKVIKDAGIHQLIQDGYLSKFDHYTIPKWDPQTVANFYCAEPEKWGKSIFYFVNLEQCFKLQQIFRERGVVSEVVTGDSDVDQQLVRFRTGEINCLINCMKLTEGFDEPSLKTAWVRDSGKGPTMQMGGRAFRKHPDLPVKNIVQSADTRWPFIKTAMPRLQYLWQSNTWASLQVNPFIEEITQQARMAIATVEVSLPKFLTDRLQKKRRLRRV